MSSGRPSGCSAQGDSTSDLNAEDQARNSTMKNVHDVSASRGKNQVPFFMSFKKQKHN